MIRARTAALLLAAGLAVGVAAASVACASKPRTAEARLDQNVEKYKERIRKEIDGPARAIELITTLDRIQATFEEQALVIERKRDELRNLARRYETTDQELEVVLADLQSQVVQLRSVLQEGHFELRDQVSADEWKAIIAERKKLLGIF